MKLVLFYVYGSVIDENSPEIYSQSQKMGHLI
jgi:hypothetical protein